MKNITIVVAENSSKIIIFLKNLREKFPKAIFCSDNPIYSENPLNENFIEYRNFSSFIILSKIANLQNSFLEECNYILISSNLYCIPLEIRIRSNIEILLEKPKQMLEKNNNLFLLNLEKYRFRF